MSLEGEPRGEIRNLLNSSVVKNTLGVINSNRTGYQPPEPVIPANNGNAMPSSSAPTNAPLVAKAQTVGQNISAPGAGMEVQAGMTARQMAELDAMAVQEAASRTKTVFLGVEADKGKDAKGKEGASADAPAAEKAVEAAPAVNAAVLSNLVEKDTRSRINESTGQAPEQQQQPQQEAKKAAEKSAENPALAPAKKGKLGGLDKATADSVNNGSLGALSKKGDKEKDKPKVATVSNSSLQKPPATPPRPQPAAHMKAPSAPSRGGK